MAKAVSMSRNPGLAKMAKTEKGKAVVKKFGYDPNRMVAKDGGLKSSDLTEEGKRRIKSRMTGGDSTGILFPEVYSGKKDKESKSKQSRAGRTNLKDGGCAQIRGFGKARRPKK